MFVLGLREKLFLILAAMALLTIICATVVIYSVSRSASSFHHVATTTLPSLRIAERLARHSERAVADIAALSAVRSEDERRHLQRRWERIEATIRTTLSQASTLPAPLADIDGLTAQISLMMRIRQRLDQAAGDYIGARRHQRERHDALLEASQKFRDILDPLITIAERERGASMAIIERDARLIVDPATIEPAAGPSAHDDRLSTLLQLRQMISDITRTLLAVEREDRPQHLELAALRTQSHAERVEALVPSLDEEVSRYLGALNQDILDAGSGPAGLPALREKIVASASEMTMLKARASELTRDLEVIIDRLIRETSSAFDQDHQGFELAQSQMSRIVLAAAACSLLVSLGLGTLYAQHQLVKPIVQLSHAMEAYEQDGSIPDSLGHNSDEIGQLGRRFIEMARHRQAAEAELAERHRMLASINIDLERANAELERSNDELDSFAYIAAHDLKEPLRAIRNHAGFLKQDYDDLLDDDGKKRLTRLIDLGGRMERLIGDLLYFARLGRGDEAIEAIDLKDLIAEIEVSLVDTLKERNARLIVNEHLPTISANKSNITAVFQNLISNATKYNDSEEKVINIGVDLNEAHGVPDEMTTLYVRDNGIGIDDKFRSDVFKIFKRLNSEKAYGAGTGAGLSFVKKIIEKQGGKIWIDSEPGKGTTFSFTLKRAA